MLTCFAFTIYEVDFNLQRSSNAYNDLGVPIDIQPNVDRDRANDFYVHLKHARDIILDPAKRFAYDRLRTRPSLRSARAFLTIKDCAGQRAAHCSFTTYSALLIVLVGANALGSLTRLMALRTALRPDHPTILSKYLNPLVASTHFRPAYLPFQIVTIIKKAAISLTQFLALLMPLYRADPQHPTKPTDDTEDTRHKQLDRLSGLVAESNKDANRLLELERDTIQRQREGKE
ncbi:unnamed protein product [Alternaria alternata]